VLNSEKDRSENKTKKHFFPILPKPHWVQNQKDCIKTIFGVYNHLFLKPHKTLV
jgi:hypothetical protein